MQSYREVPHQPGWPLLGDLPQFIKDPLAFLTQLHADHGPVARFQMGPTPGVSINDAELIHAFLVRQANIVKKSRDTRWLETILGQGLVTAEGDLWQRHRKVLAPAFQMAKLRAYATIMDQRTRSLLQTWRPGVELDIHAEMNRLTLQVVTETLFSVDASKYYDDIAEPLASIMSHYENMITSFSPFSLFPAIPTPANRQLRQSVERLDVALRAVVQDRRGLPDGEDLLSELLRADPEVRFSDKELRDELMTLLTAGHETTALALTWALMLVAQHPEVEQRLLAESAQAGVVRTPKELRYHEQVVNEAMRLYPPVWAIGRELLEDATVGKYQLKKGTQLYFSQWVTHRDAQFFDNPLRFDPDRWREPKHPRLSYFPFGAGPRACVGLNFAMLEAVVILARITESFHLELTAGQQIDLMPAVTLRPRHGLRVTPHRRQQANAA